MNSKRNRWIIITGIVILVVAVVGAFALIEPSAEDILIQTLETAKTITDGHAIVEVDIDSVEQDASGMIEVWFRTSEDGPGAFRIEVLEADEEKSQGAIIVSNGEDLWAYSPFENKVFVGTLEEILAMMEDIDFMSSKFSQIREGMDGKSDADDSEHPETAEEALQKLQEYFVIGNSGEEMVAGETTNLLKLEPIPEQMPAEYTTVGGYLKMWIGQDSNLPLAAAYTGSSLGEFTVTVLEFEVNKGIDEAIFTFEVPAGVEVITIADLQPQTLTLEEAKESAEFELLTPGETPPGATLVDIREVGGAFVLRYTLPDGGGFTVAQGISEEGSKEYEMPSTNSQEIEVRGVTGNLFVSEDGEQLMLTWTDGELFYSVAGTLTTEQALQIAETLE